MKRKGFLMIIATALSLFYAASAFSVDTLPFYAASGTTPNVLIILDRSGSMNSTPSGSSGTYCTTTNPWGSGCTDESKLSIAVRVLADLLDANNTNTVDNTDDPKALDVRLGYMKFFGSTNLTAPVGTGEGSSPVYYNGGILIPLQGGNRLNVGASYADIFNNFNSSTTSSIGTPDGTALSEALNYFQNASAVTGDACYSTTCRRKNYVILVTDGEDNETCADGEGASNRRSIVYAAKALYDAGIPVFVVGFGDLPNSGKYTLNWAAYYGNGVNLNSQRDPNPEANSGNTSAFTMPSGSTLCSAGTIDPGAAAQALLGYAFLASDATSLTNALKKAIDLTKEGSYTRSQPVLTASGNRIYSSFFDLGANVNWHGHLDAWNVDSAGVIQDSAINNPCTSSASTPVTGALRELYDAGRTLTYSSCTGYVASASRNIYTNIGASRILFNVSGTGNTSAQQIDLCTALIKTTGTCTSAESTSAAVGSSNELINFIRFSSATYNTSPGTRSSTWRLGDIWHSTPTIVGPPVGSFGSAAYNTFKSNNSTRTQALIVGANDGMLHAFNDGNYGEELWSFIPNNLLGKLKNLNTGHDFYVDASPTAADVCLNATLCGTSSELAAHWKTVVIAGERDGGNAYFALDITSTTNPLYLWQFTDANLGYTSSKPAIGKVRVKSGSNYEEHWAAFFGGGTSTDTTNNIGNSFYAVDIGTGAKFGTGSGTEYAIGTAANKVPGAPRAVDINGDFYVDAVFFGDTDGRLWKLNTTDTSPNSWSAGKIFDPALAHKTIDCTSGVGTLTEHSNGTHGLRPIYYRPALVFDSNLKPLIMFGTGYVDDNTEPGSTVQNYFYIVRLESSAYSGISSPNEYITEILSFTLDVGETVVGAPVVYDGKVWYVTYTPSAIATCCGSGTAKLRWAELKTCGATDVVDLGSGIPAGPVIGPDGIYTNTSNSPKPTKCTTCPPGPGNLSDIIYWRER